MRKEQELKKIALTSEFIEGKLIPKLKAAVEKSEGRLKSFYLYPEFDPKVKNPLKGKGKNGRYPIRRAVY